MILATAAKLLLAIVFGAISYASAQADDPGPVPFISLVLALLFGVAGLIPLLRWLFS